MLDWSLEQLARAAGAPVVSHAGRTTGPERVVIDSREAGPGTLFVGLKGAHADGGRFASQALANGAWGVLTTPEHAEPLGDRTATGEILSATDPLGSLQTLATAWRRELRAKVIGVTGSTGKTSTKDLLLALLAPHRRTVASRANFNTEIGVPLEILGAPAGTEALVLEMAMRGAGQIAELAAIAEPDVAVIVSIGPVHLELLGSIEAIAAAKAELIAGLAAGATAIVPAGARLLEPHLRDDVRTVTFGPGGDVRLLDTDGEHVSIQSAETSHRLELEVPFTQAHMRTNLLAAVAASEAIGVTPSGRVEVAFSPGRGQRLELPDGVTLIDDCYNANPMSMRAALDDLASSAAGDGDRRRVAVLGDMLELGPAERDFHVELGAYADCAGVELLVTVGRLAAAIADGFGGEAHVMKDAGQAAAILPELVEPGDVVLVKASRGVGLELVCGALGAEALA
jgi:UDP-N-acetylmuramoyl-tripeptide--D-alanyl-D-alanine ligase